MGIRKHSVRSNRSSVFSWLDAHAVCFRSVGGRPRAGERGLSSALCSQFGFSQRTAKSLLAAWRERHVVAAAERAQSELGLQRELTISESMVMAMAAKRLTEIQARGEGGGHSVKPSQASTLSLRKAPPIPFPPSALDGLISLVQALPNDFRQRLFLALGVCPQAPEPSSPVVVDPRAELSTALELYEMAGRPSQAALRLIAELRTELRCVGVDGGLL